MKRTPMKFILQKMSLFCQLFSKFGKNSFNMKSNLKIILLSFNKKTTLGLLCVLSLMTITVINLSFAKLRFLPAKSKNNSFVSLCEARLIGDHRTGNHLFMLSAMFDLAEKTGREIIMPNEGWFLDTIFDFGSYDPTANETNYKTSIFRRYKVGSKICPCKEIRTPHYNYDGRFNQSNFTGKYYFGTNPKTVEICGLSQTYLYSLNPKVAEKLRSLPYLLKNNSYENADMILKLFKMLMFKQKLGWFALYSYNGFDDKQKNSNESFSYIPLKSHLSHIPLFLRNILNIFSTGEKPFTVGVHVRMGDFLHASHKNYGLTTADKNYFRHAFEYFIKLKKTILFVVVSDDIEWAIHNFPLFFDNENLQSAQNTSQQNFFKNENLQIVFFRDNAAQDFAVLCRCDALIISTGTFGWWAAWFNYQVPIVYYEGYPRNESSLGKLLDRNNYYPNHWIPMS